MMITQEEDDLEEELRCLDIREDHGAEDSDVTPTNTPPTSLPILYIKKYPPPKPNYEEHKDFGRYSRTEEYDNRSESSLSWGDDEFEGEATRQVGVLFDQLDFLLYKEETTFSPIPYSSNCSETGSLSAGHELDISVGPVEDSEDSSSSDLIENLTRITDAARTQEYQRDIFFDVEGVDPSDILYNSNRLLKSSPGLSVGEANEPTPELQEECSSWVHQFPHFRVRGHCLNLKLLTFLEELVAEDSLVRENYEEKEEEVIAHDGDFHHLLPLVTFSSANQTRRSFSDDPKRETCSSRVCSGSNDPEVLKEQILIMLFEKLWSSVTETIEPLLHQYAKYIIEQSVQYLSLSREPSTRGSRVGSHTPIRKISEEVIRSNIKFPKPYYGVYRPVSGESNRKYETKRPSSGIKRPSSAVNRLQNTQSAPGIHQKELQDLLQISSKPLQNCEDRVRLRTSSASTTRESSAKSQISLPSLATPRTPVHRPVSSKSSNHLLTPVRVDGLTNCGEQRPATTSSYNARARFQEKFQHMSRQGTIQESWGDNSGLDIEEDALEVANSAWSRHIPFLPPIADGGDISNKGNVGKQPLRLNSTSRRRDSSTERPLNSVQDSQQPESPLMTGEDLSLSTLSVKGTTLSAAHRPHAYTRPKNHIWASGMRPVEPFLSWVVQHVDREARSVGQDEDLPVKNAFVNEENKNLCMRRTKHFRRYFHH
ncbi:uncharacterized protein LOC121855991 isoform X1 [Homarus americanus]|uniref:uncharacterized protein LOC121855991 isoform X1 n=1 Tax=Homarus americanus TaxID=6706 RepID=UPI001C46D1BE|nr:uncharacterized protein LOC121855991 isoform X1 [Homarus americanus]